MVTDASCVTRVPWLSSSMTCPLPPATLTVTVPSAATVVCWRLTKTMASTAVPGVYPPLPEYPPPLTNEESVLLWLLLQLMPDKPSTATPAMARRGLTERWRFMDPPLGGRDDTKRGRPNLL